MRCGGFYMRDILIKNCKNEATDPTCTRNQGGAMIIISTLAVLLIWAGILFIMLLLPKNGIVTVKNDDGTTDYYMYLNDEARYGWQVRSGLLCYFDENGKMLKDKQVIDEKEYYFIPSNGQLAANRTITYEDGSKITYNEFGNPKGPTEPGLFTQQDGTTALYGTNGRLTGWREVNGIKYYFQLRTGRMLKNERAFIKDRYYDFDENGIAAEVIENDQSNTN